MGVRNPQTILLAQNVPYELRPPRSGREYLSIENLGAQTVTYAEDTIPVSGVDADIPIAGVGNNNWREWTEPAAVPQRTIWLLCTNAAGSRVKVIEGAK